MAYEKIVEKLDSEIANLQKAKRLLTGETAPKKPSGRVITAQGRENIAEAQRKRWAKQKRSA